MNYVENNETEYQELAYDLIYPEVLKHRELFLESKYNTDMLSEYDCIVNYLINETKIKIMKPYAYVKINDYPYTATVRCLESFRKYLNTSKEKYTLNVFGQIDAIGGDASLEWIAELKQIIAEKKEQLMGINLGSYYSVIRNQGERDACVISIDGNEAVIEYEMPNGTSALNIVTVESLMNPESKDYKNITYMQLYKSKRFDDIDLSILINNPQSGKKYPIDGSL
jgi:hypothetical protein